MNDPAFTFDAQPEETPGVTPDWPENASDPVARGSHMELLTARRSGGSLLVSIEFLIQTGCVTSAKWGPP